MKGTTLHLREGNPYPRMAETPMGMLNAVGLQNKGVHYFVDHIYPQIKDIRTNMIVNVSGSQVEDYAETASIINELENIPAIELEHFLPEREARRNGFRCDGPRSSRSGERRAQGLQEDFDCEAVAQRDRHHRNCPCGRRCRSRQRVAHQHPAGYGHRRGSAVRCCLP